MYLRGDDDLIGDRGVVVEIRYPRQVGYRLFIAIGRGLGRGLTRSVGEEIAPEAIGAGRRS